MHIKKCILYFYSKEQKLRKVNYRNKKKNAKKKKQQQNFPQLLNNTPSINLSYICDSICLTHSNLSRYPINSYVLEK